MAPSESVATSSNGGSCQFAGPLIASLPSCWSRSNRVTNGLTWTLISSAGTLIGAPRRLADSPWSCPYYYQRFGWENTRDEKGDCETYFPLRDENPDVALPRTPWASGNDPMPVS